MSKKETNVELQAGNARRSFTISHAEKLMKMPNNGGWHLPEDSDFKLDSINGINLRGNKSAPKSTAKSGDNSESL